LRAYRTSFPDVELQLQEMDTSRQIAAIEDHRLDLGFIGLGQSSDKLSKLEFALVAEERLYAAVPDNHPLATRANRQRGVALHSLANERLLLADSQSAPLFNPWVMVLCQQAGFQPSAFPQSFQHSSQQSGQPIALLNYVAAGLGITIHRWCLISAVGPPRSALSLLRGMAAPKQIRPAAQVHRSRKTGRPQNWPGAYSQFCDGEINDHLLNRLLKSLLLGISHSQGFALGVEMRGGDGRQGGMFS
jgi:DNA-binding transcriptional LysR family regulator